MTQSRQEAELRERKQLEHVKQRQGGQQMINVKQLCEMTGTKYYEHNDEIMMADHREVQVYDENDVHIGIMTLVQAKQQAKLVGKDLVVRNLKRDPPITRITDYRKELMKKWFKTLSKEFKSAQSKKK